MAGLYGIDSVTVTLEDAPGGTARSMTGFITGGIEVGEKIVSTETTALGDSAREHTPTGLAEYDDITMVVLWDTTATTGTHAVLTPTASDRSPQAVGRELVVVMGDSKTYTQDVRLISAKPMASIGDVQRMNVTLRPTGLHVWS